MLICCVTNEPYVKFTLAMLNSLRHNCKKRYKVLCCCINVTQESIDKISSLDVEIIEINKELSTKKELLTPDGTTLTPIWKRDKRYGSLISEEACFCSNYRFNIVLEAMTKSDYVLFLDVDAIIRRDLSDMLETYKHNDITIRKTINEGVAGRQKQLLISEPNNIIFQQGVFLVKCSNITEKFYTVLSKLVMNDWKNWNADQIYFYRELSKHDIILGQLDTKYRDVATNPIDGGLKDCSFIWSGAWTDKYNNERYINEYTKYRIQS